MFVLILQNGATALHLASRFNNFQCVGALLQRKDLNINAIDSEGNSALMYAARSAEPDCIKLLLNDSRINVNIVNKQGKTARDIAQGSGKRGIKRTLTRKLFREYYEKYGLNKKGDEKTGNKGMKEKSNINQRDLTAVKAHLAEKSTTKEKSKAKLDKSNVV